MTEDEIRKIAREEARREVSSLAGLMMRRLQDETPTRSGERNFAVDVMQSLWGEALADFSGHTRGEQPGD
jgi:hypothetical protein